jgi:hypothetical protein
MAAFPIYVYQSLRLFMLLHLCLSLYVRLIYTKLKILSIIKPREKAFNLSKQSQRLNLHILTQ